MLAGLIGDVVPPAEPADLLVLGFAIPDVWPERATATFLSHACPGSPLAFAVCDQGSAAGFTALRLARDYAASGGGPRVLVALAEQARLDYDPPAPVSVPARHAAFAMLCDTAPAPAAGGPGEGGPGEGGASLLEAVRVVPGVAAGQVPGVLRDLLAGLPVTEPGGEKPPGAERSLVLGEGLAPLAGGDLPGWRSGPLPPGQPLTGVWRELASWAARPGRGSLAIADYDPGLRYLCLAHFARA
jgi:4-hydroxymandelate oxidase